MTAAWRERLGGEPHVAGRGRAGRARRSRRVTGAGLAAVRGTIFSMRAASPSRRPRPRRPRSPSTRSTGPRAVGFGVERTAEHSFRIAGPSVERLVERHDLENPDALAYIEERLKAMGVVKQLESRGFEPGDEVEIGEVAFALYPGIPQE